LTKPISGVTFGLGKAHPIYDALSSELITTSHGYAWYMRVADCCQFIGRIGPVLEDRLANSVMAAYSGILKINFYTEQFRLKFEDGRFISADPYEPKSLFDGDAFFPGLTFLQILFGYKSLKQVKEAYPDCFTEKAETQVLLDVLFPKKHSKVIPIA